MKLLRNHLAGAVCGAVALAACASKEVRVEAPKKAPVAQKPVIEQIQERLRSRNSAVANCYEKNVDTTLKKGDKPKTAEVLTKFSIAGDGTVKNAKIAQSTLGNHRAEACILDVIKSTPFPKPESPAGLEITYPFKFTAEAPAAH